MKKIAAALIALTTSVAAQAQEVGDLVRFVSCPVYRDTDSGRKSGCWLATDPATSQRWDITQSPIKPNWDYGVLVEGRVSAEAGDACGAPVLDPVRDSRLTSIDCTRHMLPAEGYEGRVFVAPDRYITPLANRPVFEGPFEPRTFYAFFEFDDDFMIYQYSDFIVQQAAYWIEDAQPSKLIVTGFAATDPVEINGVTLAEQPEIAQRRAEMITETLHRLMPDMEIETRWETGAQIIDVPDADTIPWQSQRRAEIEVVF